LVTFSQKSNRSPRRRKNAVSFLPSFFLCGSCAKEKSVIKGKLTFIYQNFLAAFLCQNRHKEKLTKEMACQGLRALEPRHYSWRATFKKVDETIAQSECEHSAQPFDKSKFEHSKGEEK
jgi:hypothetical protein